MNSRTRLLFSLAKSRQFDPFIIITLLALRKGLIGCDDVLDIGCGSSRYMRWLGVKHAVGLEGHQPSFEKAKKLNTHDELVNGNVLALDQYFKSGQFDACMAVDVIEHLTKEEGLKLIERMEAIARHKVVFITPSGFLPQRSFDNNNLQEHLSGWDAAEMEKLGYRVIGRLGPKELRGEQHYLKRRPKIFWGLVSLFLDIFWTRKRPAKAASIICIKTKLSPNASH